MQSALDRRALRVVAGAIGGEEIWDVRQLIGDIGAAKGCIGHGRVLGEQRTPAPGAETARQPRRSQGHHGHRIQVDKHDIVLVSRAPQFLTVRIEQVIDTESTIAQRLVKGIQVYSQEMLEFEGYDTIVLSAGNVAHDHLYFELKGKVKELYRIGDCVAPRKTDMAIMDGHRVGRLL